jgi:diguanylate cyclase (GGDEF)-like protein
MEFRLRNPITSAVGQHAGVPQLLTEFTGELNKLDQALQPGSAVSSAASLPNDVAPVLATVAAYKRRRFVTELEDQRARAVTGELLKNLDAQKAALDALLKAEWYRTTTSLRLPRLTDFVAQAPVDTIEPSRPPKPRDDKFRILWSASALLGDLKAMWEECETRSTPLSIAFVDIDRLKDFNTSVGELWVDTFIFPPVMRSIERAVFGHGHAYRYGGDEFAVLIPSANEEVALPILQRVRKELAGTTFENGEKLPTISIGLCVVQPDSPLTDREALQWAILAKREAKRVRNVIAVVTAGREIDMPACQVL